MKSRPEAFAPATNRWIGVSMASMVLLSACGGGGDDAATTERATAQSVSPSCGSRVNNTFDKLLECVTLEGVREHQAALQAIADANGGTRAAGTPGYDASVEYVVDKMTAAGYNVTLNAFPFVYVAAADAAADSRRSPPPTRPAPSPAPATAT